MVLMYVASGNLIDFKINKWSVRKQLDLHVVYRKHQNSRQYMETYMIEVSHVSE